jgi:hypothetical protein
MDLKFILYCFLSVVIIFGGSFYYYGNNSEAAAAVYFLGTIVASIFFGFRWFATPEAKSIGPGTWPPSINYCPDFLTLTKDADGLPVCVDMIGVARGGTSNIKVSDGSNNFFNLKNIRGTITGQDLCDSISATGLTWEGVRTGTTCTGVAPPAPP